MVTMDPERARAFIRAINEDARAGSERSKRADIERIEDVVYYIQFRDVIKIGTSRQLDTRLSLLPWEILHAVEPGDRIVERHRHRQFRLDHHLNEWFKPSRALKAHIDDINQRNASWRAERFPELHLPYRNPAVNYPCPDWPSQHDTPAPGA